jgi:hypothetical protein
MRRDDSTLSVWALEQIHDRRKASSLGRPRLQADTVVYGILKSLFAAEVSFSSLNRYVTEEELNLLKLPSGLMAKPCAGSTEVMRGDYAYATVRSRFANDGPNDLRRKSVTLNSSSLAYGSEERSIP